MCIVFLSAASVLPPACQLPYLSACVWLIKFLLSQPAAAGSRVDGSVRFFVLFSFLSRSVPAITSNNVFITRGYMPNYARCVRRSFLCVKAVCSSLSMTYQIKGSCTKQSPLFLPALLDSTRLFLTVPVLVFHVFFFCACC